MKLKSDIKDWFGRIHIGCWKDTAEWRKSVGSVVRRWLASTPMIENATADVMTWQKAGLVMGVGDGISSGIKTDLCEELAALDEDAINPEHLLLAYALRVRPRNVDAFVAGYDSETIPYRKHATSVRFVDTLGMVVPYLHWIGRDDMAIRQMNEYDCAMWKHIFPAHAYNVKQKLPMGVFDWSRGCGWYILALLETSDMDGVKNKVLNLADALLPLQKADGGYGAFLFNENSRMEASGTALIGLLMLLAYDYTQMGGYLDCAKKCEKALMGATRRNGCVDYCQGDTIGIGIYSQTFSLMPFAQGMTLRLSNCLKRYC